MTMREILENIEKHISLIMDMESFGTGVIQYEDEFGSICERNVLQETRNEMINLFVQLGKEEGFIRFMTPEEKKLNEKMLKGINRSICQEAAFQAEFEMRRKEAHDETLLDVEREFADELTEDALDKLCRAEDRTAEFKEAYYEFARNIKDRMDSAFEDAYYAYLNEMVSQGKELKAGEKVEVKVNGESWGMQYVSHWDVVNHSLNK